jgi:hypothetical protein
MSNIKDIKREELIDMCESLYIKGFRKPYQVQKLLGIADFRTAEKYLKIGSRRAYRRNRNINKERLFQEQLNVLDLIIHECWQMYLDAKSVNEKVGALNALCKVLKQKTGLLGLEAPKEIIIDSNNKGETLFDILKKMPDEQARAIADQLDTFSAKPIPPRNFQPQVY